MRDVAVEESDCDEPDAAAGVRRAIACNGALPFEPPGWGVVGVAVCVEPLEVEEVEGAGETDRDGRGVMSGIGRRWPFGVVGEAARCAAAARARSVRTDVIMYWKAMLTIRRRRTPNPAIKHTARTRRASHTHVLRGSSTQSATQDLSTSSRVQWSQSTGRPWYAHERTVDRGLYCNLDSGVGIHHKAIRSSIPVALDIDTYLTSVSRQLPLILQEILRIVPVL